MERDKILINNQQFDLRVYFSNKKYSSGKFNEDKIILRLPNHLNEKDRQEHIRLLLKKLEKKIISPTKKIKRFEPLAELFIKEKWQRSKLVGKTRIGELKLHNNVKYNVFHIHRAGNGITIKLNKSNIIIKSQNLNNLKLIKSRLLRVIGNDQHNYLFNLVNQYNTIYIKKKINRVLFKNITSRWGSCSSKKNINIAVRLLFLPRYLLNYVVVHELAHLIQMNHSNKFWSLVKKILPNNEFFRQELKTYS